MAVQGEPMANTDDKELTTMLRIANKLNSLRLSITGDKRLITASDNLGFHDYGYLVGQIEEVHKLLNQKIRDLKAKQQSSKSQIQRNTDRTSRKEGDFWDADRP